MYSKTIKRGNKNYTYYYHNFKENGVVKNICLGSDINKVGKKLEEIKSSRSSQQQIITDSKSEPIRKNNTGPANLFFLIILISALSLLFLHHYYPSINITGYSLLEDTFIELTVNGFISHDANVLLVVQDKEFSKSISRHRDG